jgi:hypothetical protein
MKLMRQITGLKIDSDTRSNEKSHSYARSYRNETGRAKHNRRAKLQHITDAKPLEFLAIAKREAFKEARSEAQRNERRAKRR